MAPLAARATLPMLDVYMCLGRYNKVGNCESFKGFVREWHAAYKALEQKQAAGKTASPLEECVGLYSTLLYSTLLYSTLLTATHV